MNKDVKAMKYSIDVMEYLKLGDAIIDGKTEKEAKELEGEWVKINETMFAFVEDDRTTMIRTVGDTELGCGSHDFDSSTKLMSKYMIAFKDLKNNPQISIESSEYRWLQVYLLSKKWYVEDRYLYPPMPEATEELSPVDEETTPLHPVHEDKPIGEVDLPELPPDEEARTISRKCPYCGHGEKGTDFAKVKQDIAEHILMCQKNPVNKAKSPSQEVPETTAPKKPTVAKSAPVETPKKEMPQKEKKPPSNEETTAMVKRDAVVKKEMPTEAQFQTAAVGRILKNQGSIYKAGGKEVADSAAVSNYAVAVGVSTKTTMLEQTAEYARATVRAYRGKIYTEGSVLIRRDAIIEKVVIDLAEKHQDWIIGWSNGLPEFDLNRIIHVGDARKILGLHIAGVVADRWMFASRDCETKARRRAEIQVLGADWREDDEVNSEVEEMETVAKRR